MGKRRFKCSLDTLSMLISGLLLLLGLALIAAPGFFERLDLIHPGPKQAGILLLTLNFTMFLLMPRELVVDLDGFRVQRWLLSRSFDWKDVVDVRIAAPVEMKWAVRTFGNGGLFGYTGYCRNPVIGSMLWYCTRRSNYVLVSRTTGPVVVITPDDPEGFLAHYKTVNVQ